MVHDVPPVREGDELETPLPIEREKATRRESLENNPRRVRPPDGQNVMVGGNTVRHRRSRLIQSPVHPRSLVPRLP